MFIEQPPTAFRRLYPGALWRMDTDEHTVYLTFDDGPDPVVTPWVLSLLEEYDARATFFMVGDNIRKHPETFRMVAERGHRIGNHTFNHIRGFSRAYFRSTAYMANAEEAHRLMLQALADVDGALPLEPLLFRPPHGHMGWGQYYKLKQRYRIVMWDLVTRDYSRRLRPPQVLSNVLRYARNGSIITFHDSQKSWNNGNLQYALTGALRFLKSEGYNFGLL